MGLAQTRPEKAKAMTAAVGELRNTLAQAAGANELNIAEATSVAAQLFSSLIVGAYRDAKSREVVILALPDVIRAYIPQWEKIYADFLSTDGHH